MTKRKRRVVAAALLAVLAVGGVWLYLGLSSPARRIPGTYHSTGWDGKSRVIQRFDADGAWKQDVYPPGADMPSTTVAGRWRVAGRMLILETGPAASPGLFGTFAERFSAPLLGSSFTRARIVAADDSQLVISHGPDADTGRDVTEVLTRRQP